MVRLGDGIPDELGRTVVLLEPSYVIIEGDKLPTLCVGERSSAFSVLPAVDNYVIQNRQAYMIVKPLLESPEHILAVLGNGVEGVYRINAYTDIMPINVRLFLEPSVPIDIGPLALEFKKASEYVRRLERRLSAIQDERALLLDRVHADPGAGLKLSELANEEQSLRRSLHEALSRRRAAGNTLWNSLKRFGLENILIRLQPGQGQVSIPLLNQSIPYTVGRRAEITAKHVYRHVCGLIGYRPNYDIHTISAIARLVKDINMARCNGRSEAWIWIRSILRVKSGERFGVMFSLNGRSRGVSIIDSPFMPDPDTLSQLIPANIRHIFGDNIIVREEDVMDALGNIRAIGESSIQLTAGLKAVIDFQPQIQQVGEQP